MPNLLKDSIEKNTDLNICGSVLRLLNLLKDSTVKKIELNVCGSVQRLLSLFKDLERESNDWNVWGVFSNCSVFSRFRLIKALL